VSSVGREADDSFNINLENRNDVVGRYSDDCIITDMKEGS
jgi:hypothetical protein